MPKEYLTKTGTKLTVIQGEKSLTNLDLDRKDKLASDIAYIQDNTDIDETSRIESIKALLDQARYS